jgi:hypothetical protein
MTTPPIYIGPREVLEQARECLQDHIAPVLAAIGAAHGLTLPVPVQYWTFPSMPRNPQSPSVGLSITAAPVVAMGAMGSNDVAYEVLVVVMLRLVDMPPTDPDTEQDLSYMHLACLDYADALVKVLQARLALGAYRDASYVYRVDLSDGAAQAFIDDGPNEDYVMAHGIPLTVYQRVSARVPIEAPP